MSSASSDSATLTLALSFLVAGYLTFCCWTPPNPSLLDSASSLPKDRLGYASGAIQARRFITLSLCILHILLTILFASPPAVLCPNQDNLSRSLFTWSPYTTAVLMVIVIAAPIRLLAFKQLGKSFTFVLAKPKALVKTGLYAYVQHPSYPTNWLILTSNTALLLSPHGVLGCILPSWVVNWGAGSGLVSFWSVLFVVTGFLGLFAIWVRVKDEEAMLKKKFGKEWEEYHRRTKRFIPGLF